LPAIHHSPLAGGRLAFEVRRLSRPLSTTSNETHRQNLTHSDRETFDNKMKPASVIILLVCAAILVASAIHGHQQLPDKIASHFNGGGVANGWMGRSSYTMTMLAVGFGIPAFVVGIMYSIRFFPAEYLNVPNPSYWREPKNYKKACDFLFFSAIWFASAFLLWQAFFSRLIVTANLVSPPHLNSTHALLMTVPLVAFTFAWVVLLILRFLKTK
jgi:uncharacterized membrane protein